MLLSNMLKKILIMFVFIMFFGVLIYFVFQRGETIKREVVPTMVAEFDIIDLNKDKIIDIMKTNISENLDKINARTCKGFLYDNEKNGKYDKPLLDKNIDSLRKNMIIKYNFCAFNKTKENHFLLMFSTITLVNDFMKKEMGEDYIPVLIIDIDNKGNVSKKGFISSEILLEGL